ARPALGGGVSGGVDGDADGADIDRLPGEEGHALFAIGEGGDAHGGGGGVGLGGVAGGQREGDGGEEGEGGEAAEGDERGGHGGRALGSRLGLPALRAGAGPSRL